MSYEPNLIALEWEAGPANDMYADGVLVSILQLQNSTNPKVPSEDATTAVSSDRFKEYLIEALQDMYGSECVSKSVGEDQFPITVDEKEAILNLRNMTVKCPQDSELEGLLQSTVTNLHQVLCPGDIK